MLPHIWFIESYSLLIFIGIAACIFVVDRYLVKQTRWPLNAVIAVEMNGIVAILIGFVGSNIMQNIYDFIENPAQYIYSTAYTFFGGLIFGIASFLLGYVFFIQKKHPRLMDDILVIAPGAITLAHAFGRIGCFLNGCCHGHVTDAWYGMYFPNLDATVIPTNLYEAIFLFMLSGVLLWLAYKKHHAQTLSIYLIAYGIFRFFIEYLRGDERGEFVPFLSPSQFWSIVAVVTGLGLLGFYYYREHRKRITTLK